MTGPLHIIDAPAIWITGIDVGVGIELHSTGTDALNVGVQTRPDLTTNVWFDVGVQSNVFADGTNTTQVALPANDNSFFRIQQGFF